MGMTIDECIEIWTYPTQYFPTKREEAVDFAMDTMRKYKKIEEILDDCDLEAWEILEEIKEVVKDGNN
jgi:hypothetical protein